MGGGQCDLCVAMPTRTQVQITAKGVVKKFEFDRCYWSHNKEHKDFATQEIVYKELGVNMLTNAMHGFNNCIFAYGQTGSGKSYSVLGGAGKEKGMLPRVVEGLFDHLQKQGKDATCKTMVAFLEIYNEQIHDLLTHQKKK